MHISIKAAGVISGKLQKANKHFKQTFRHIYMLNFSDEHHRIRAEIKRGFPVTTALTLAPARDGTIL